jgi:hypothetical protein
VTFWNDKTRSGNGSCPANSRIVGYPEVILGPDLPRDKLPTSDCVGQPQFVHTFSPIARTSLRES